MTQMKQLQLNIVSRYSTIYNSRVHKQSQSSQAVASLIKGMSHPHMYVSFTFEVCAEGKGIPSASYIQTS